MTVLGPIAPGDLGPTDGHEHLFLETPAQPEDTLADFDRALAELAEGKASGLRAVVELTPIGLGRRADLLAEASRSTGVHVVAATGYHRDAHYRGGHWVYDASVQALADRVIAELTEGIEDGIRAGVIKGGASRDYMSRFEQYRLRAIAEAAVATRAPVIVHTEAGTAGPLIVDLLTSEGLAEEKITLAHLDRNPDGRLHLDLLERGINLVYDTIGRRKYATDEERIDLIEAVVLAGFGGQLMLGLDLGRREYHRAYGGRPGMRHLMATFMPRLRDRIGDAAANALLIGNPARILAVADA
jgi:phosphotriesterase-related protein